MVVPSSAALTPAPLVGLPWLSRGGQNVAQPLCRTRRPPSGLLSRAGRLVDRLLLVHAAPGAHARRQPETDDLLRFEQPNLGNPVRPTVGEMCPHPAPAIKQPAKAGFLF